MSAQAQQQQQAAASSAQISSMQQYGAGGGAESQGFNSLFDLFINGLGKDQSLSLQNVGLGKMFTSGEVTAGLHAPGGKSMGKFMEGLESSWEMGGGGQEGGAEQQAAPQAHGDEMQQQQMAEQQANHYNPNEQQGGQMPYGQSNEQMPHGYGPDQTGGQNAMGMGGGQAGDNYGQQGAGGTPFGYGPDNDDKGMFNTTRLDKSDGIDPFAAAFDTKSGQFDDAQRMRYADTGYKKDESGSDDSSSDDDSKRGATNPVFNRSVGDGAQAAGPVVEADPSSQRTADQTPAEARAEARERRRGEGAAR